MLVSLAIVGCASTPRGVSADPARSALSPEPATLPVEAIRTEVVVEGLEHPWGMVWLPSGDILITERPGRLRIVRGGRLDPRPIAGVAPVSGAEARQLFASLQGGLLDVALHPRYRRNRWVYFSYAHGSQEANRTRVARARFDGALIRLQAQNRSSHLGKVVRLHDDGSIQDDNPFVDDPKADPAVWSVGHRNIEGMAFDPLQRRVWATEHGSRGGDELNRIRPGRNYGWPVVSLSAEYSSGQPVAPLTTAAGMDDPRRVWMATIAPSGLAVYTAARFPQWRGNLFANGAAICSPAGWWRGTSVDWSWTGRAT
jgi:glucose/arabinose dehydrogenase